MEFKERSRSLYAPVSWVHEPLRSGSRGVSGQAKARTQRTLSKGQGGVGPTFLKSAPAHRRRCERWTWKSRSWGTCLGALLGYLHFHAGLDSWKMNKSIPRWVERGSQFLPCYSFWIPSKSRNRDTRALRLDVSGAQGKEGGRKEVSLSDPCETASLPLTQGQGRPWRGQSSHVVSPGPHSQPTAAACSPRHALSPLGPGGEGAAGPQVRAPSSRWPRSGARALGLTWF